MYVERTCKPEKGFKYPGNGITVRSETVYRGVGCQTLSFKRAIQYMLLVAEASLLLKLSFSLTIFFFRGKLYLYINSETVLQLAFSVSSKTLTRNGN